MRSIATMALVLVVLSEIHTKAQTRTESTSSGIEPAQIVSTAEPVYPPNVVNPGTVVLNVTVGTSGEIEDVKVSRPAPGFTDSALAAIKKWKFKPASFAGKPIRSVVPVAFSFSQPLIWRP